VSDKVNKALRHFQKKNNPHQVVTGVVKEVDETNYTISVAPVDGGALYHQVRLRPLIDGKSFGLVIVPEVKANVLIGIIGNNDNAPYFISADLIKKVLVVTTSGTAMVIYKNGDVVFNEGNNGGLTITPKLQSELNKTNEVVKAIQRALLGWTPVPNDGGAALKALAATTIGALQVGDYAQIENDKVRH
jgi:hypothetical protein